MSKITRSSIKNASTYTPGEYLLSAADLYVERFYPHCQKIDLSKPSSFVLSALAYTANCIFIPIAPPNLKYFSNRIKSDIEKLKAVKYQPTIIYYFVDSKLSVPVDKLLQLSISMSSDGYKVSIIDEKSLIEKIISSNKSPELINKNELKSYYDTLYNAPLVEHSVLEEIFSFVNSPAKDDVEIAPFEDKLIHLKEKININFIPRNYRAVKDTYDSLWVNKVCVEHFIKLNYHKYKRQFYTILDMVRSSFKNNSANKKKSVEYPVADPAIFDELSRLIIPPEKQHDPRYFGSAKAIILFFFEYCDFGKKSPDDPQTLFPPNHGANDSSNQI